MQHAKLGDRDPKNYRDENGNRTIKVGADGTIYRGYLIMRKRDFGEHGYRSYGHMITEGYIIGTGPMTNSAPGAAWFHTVPAAMRAIDDLILAESLEDGPGRESPFWALSRFRRNCEERAPELALLLQAVIDDEAVRLNGTLISNIYRLLDQIDANCDTRDTVVDGDKRSKIGERTTARFSIPKNREG